MIFISPFTAPHGAVFGACSAVIAGEAGGVCRKSELEGEIGLAGLGRKERERRHTPPGQHLWTYAFIDGFVWPQSYGS